MIGFVEAHERHLLGGRFEVLEMLGRGGMGVVYRARDCERGIEVALKTLRGISPESVLRFKHEFRALRDVRHPNLVELGELFENEGTWFFTMELVHGQQFLHWVHSDRGGDEAPVRTDTLVKGASEIITSVATPMSVVLRKSVARDRRDIVPTPVRDVARLRAALAGLARGLAALHAAGIVHRDVKPSNILIQPDGRVVLVDFGVVAELKHGMREKLVMGTLRYMSPEQARGERVGPEADWYAMGMVLYQALTGRLPYDDLGNDELIVLKQALDIQPPSRVASGIPPDLDAVAQSLLERDPAKRPIEAEIFETLGIATEEPPLVPLRAHDQLFVGRTLELAQLEETLAVSRAHAATAIIEGESGVGKTALVARFLDVARDRDRRLAVLQGRCHERERVPFNALDGVIDDLTRFLLAQRNSRLERLAPAGVRELLAVFPTLRAVTVFADAANFAQLTTDNERRFTTPIGGLPTSTVSIPRTPRGLLSVEAAHTARGLEEDTRTLSVPPFDVPEDVSRDLRGRAFRALRELFVRLCQRRAVVIAIEDIQWADRDSLALLRELFDGPDAPRVCLVATSRPGQVDASVHELGIARTIALAGLDPFAAEELVRRVAGDVAVNAAAIIAETHGHPLFLLELARQPVTMRLDEAIWSRATKLDAAAQHLLAAVAAAGSPTPRHIVLAAAGLGIAEAESHVTALTRAQLVRVHGPRPVDAIEPFHDRIREAIYSRQSPERQRELGNAIARALEDAGAPAAQLISRFEAAGDVERTAHYVVAAAEAARAAFAFGRAADLFRRALEMPNLTNDRRAWLLVQLGDALTNDGRTAEGAECYLEAAALAEPQSVLELDLLRRAAERFLMGGKLEQGLDTARAVLARAGMTLPRSRLRTFAGLLWNQLRMRGRALHWDEPRGDKRSLEADICWSIGAGLSMVDTLLGAYFNGRAARLALKDGNALQITRGMAAATIGACVLGRRDRAARLMGCCERAAADVGSPLANWYVGLGRTGTSFILDNDFARAYQDASTLENEWYAAGHGPSWETDVAMHFSLASLQMLGEFGELAARVATLAQTAKRNGNVFQEVTLRVRFAVRHLLDDRPDDACADVLDALAAWLPGSDAFGNQRAWGLWSLSRTALYSGEIHPDRYEREWHRMHRSLIGRVPLMQAEWFHVYGTYLLGCAIDAKQRGQHSIHAALCRRAERYARKLSRLNFRAAGVSGAMLQTAVVWARGGDVVEATRKGLDAIATCNVLPYAPFFVRRLGEAIGGDEGATLIAHGDAQARRAGWTVPERGAELAIPTGRFRA